MQSELLIVSEFSSDSFQTYNDWIVTPPVTNAISNCGAYGIVFGGFEKFGENVIVYKNYDLQNYAHFGLRVEVKFLKIDSWEEADWVDIYIGGEKRHRISLTQDEEGQDSQCGKSDSFNFKEKLYSLSSRIVPFYSNNVEVKFISNLNGRTNDKSWGFRDLAVFLLLCHPTCLTCSGPLEKDCLTCSKNALLISGSCLCRDYYFMNVSSSLCQLGLCNSCKRCHFSCRTCKGENSNDCLSCNQPDIFSANDGHCSYPESKQRIYDII